MKQSDKLREWADALDYIEENHNIECSAITGITCMGIGGMYFRKIINIDELWQYVAVENYGFIGIMPNQWRPEIHINAMVKNVRIPIYNFQSTGFHNSDGGFIDEYPVMMEKLKNAPDFIKNKITALYHECVNSTKKQEIEDKLKNIDKQKGELENELKNY